MFRIIAIILFLNKAETSGPRVSWKEEGLLIMVLLRLSGLALWLSVVLYLFNPQWMPWAGVDLPLWVRWSGVGIVALSLPLLYWLFRSIGTNITPTVAIKQGHQLITSEPAGAFERKPTVLN